MKKNTKLNKFMAGSVTAALVASAVAPAVSAAENNFQDIVALDAEAQAAINALADAGVVKGYDNGTKFDPWQNVKRGQVALMLTRVAELGLDSEADTDTNFTDVTGDIELIGAVEALVNEEIASGYTDGTFKPYAQISRQHMAKLIVKAFGLELNEDVEVNITDLDEATTEMAEYIKILASHGITTQTEFNPQAPVSRYAFTLFLTRAIDAINTAEIVEVSELETITVKEGEELELPETVEVTYADETTGEEAVEWNTEDVDTNVPGEYEVEGTIEGTELTANVEVVVEAVEPEVKSVSAINAKQVVVTFNKAIKADSVINEASANALKNITITGTGAPAFTGQLSEDKKSLVLSADEGLTGEYTINIDANAVETTDGKFVASYVSKFNVNDQDAPTIAGVERVNTTSLKVNFSEPLSDKGNVSFKYADGTDVTGATFTLDVSGTFGIVDLSAGTVETQKAIDVQFIGAKDFANNLLTPNPATVSVQKGVKDGVAPTVTSLTVTAPNKLEIKFSEEVQGLETTDFSGVTVSKVEQSKTDKTKYTLTLDAPQEGVKTVTLAASEVTDLSGETNVEYSKIVEFVKDAIAPELDSSQVVKDSKDGKEYLVLTFNKSVTLKDEDDITLTGKKVKDYVTINNVSVTIPDDKLVAVEDSTTTFKVALADLLDGEAALQEGAVYTLGLPVGLVQNVSNVENAAKSAAITFTRGKDTNVSPVVAQTVSTVLKGTGNSQVVVTFGQDVDGATATNVANYKIDGTVVEKAEILDADNKKVVTLTLKADSTTFSGLRNYAISGVKTVEGGVLEATAKGTINLTENVAPTATKAAVTSATTIEVTFSESIEDVEDQGDFEVFQGTSTVALGEVSEVIDGNKVVITLSEGLTSLSGLVVKASSTIDITDTNLNATTFKQISVQ